MKIHIQGRLQTSKWQDKETGKELRKTEVVATDMMILTPMAGNKENGAPEGDTETPAATSGAADMGENVDFSAIEELGDDKDPSGSGTPF